MRRRLDGGAPEAEAFITGFIAGLAIVGALWAIAETTGWAG